MVNGIFVSYRRSDSAGWTGRLVAELSERLAATRIFIDIDAVAAGQDFHEAIESALSTSRVVLAIIGPRWLEPVEGRRRLFDADDLVATEVARALARPDVHVIPVLVGDAHLPNADELPERLAALARRQAIQISDSRWGYDIDRLVRTLTELGLQERKAGWLRAFRYTIATLLLLVGATLAWNLQREGVQPSGPNGGAVASIDQKKSGATAEPAPNVAAPPTSSPEAVGTRMPPATTTTTEGLANSRQPGATSAAPRTAGSPAAASGPASRRADRPSSATAQVSLDGLWASEFARFSDESRRREVIRLRSDGLALFGESWQETWHEGASTARLYRKFSFGDGKIDGKSISFCIPISVVGGYGVEKYRNCYSGVVDGNAIGFRVTYYVDHPRDTPEHAQIVVRRIPD